MSLLKTPEKSGVFLFRINLNNRLSKKLNNFFEPLFV